MPITLSGTRITVQYIDGDSKGNSTTNSYMFNDIVVASDASEWDPPVTRQGNSYLIPYSLYIDGSVTYFGASHYTYDYDTMVYFENNSQVDSHIFYSNGSHIRFGNDYRNSLPSVFITCSPDLDSEKTYFVIVGDVILRNTSISRARYPTIAGDANYIAYIINSQLHQAYWGYNYNNRTHIDGLKIYGNYYNMKANSELYYNNNIQLYGGSIPLISDTTSAINVTVRNLKISGGTGTSDTLVRSVGSNGLKKVYFLDCDIDFDRMSFYGATTQTNSNTYQYVQTSLNVDVLDENSNYTDCSINIYANDTSLLYSSDVSTGKLIDIPFTYAYKLYNIESGVVTQTTIDYQPLKIEISKDRYDKLVIQNVNITKGKPTKIYGTLVPFERPKLLLITKKY